MKTFKQDTYQAIETKYVGPTNTKGTRVRAVCIAGSLIVPWDAALDPSANHIKAAWLLVQKLRWDKFSGVKTLKSGVLRSGNFCHVLTHGKGTK